MPSKQKKTCFVVAAIGEARSAARKRADTVYRDVIKPAVYPLGYRAFRADRICSSRPLPEALIETVLTADLVVADLAGASPNVMYELGVRHAWNLPAVQIAPKGTTLPSDVSGVQTVFYGDIQKKHERLATISAVRMLAQTPPTHEGPVAVLQESLASASKRILLTLLYNEYEIALQDLASRLRNVKRELEREISPPSSEVSAAFALLIGPSFGALHEKARVFQSLALQLPEGSFQHLLDKGRLLLEEGDAIVRDLAESSPTAAALARARRQVAEAAATASSLAKAVREAAEGTAPPRDIRFGRRGRIAYETLRTSDRTRVREVLRAVARAPITLAEDPNAKRLDMPGEQYLVPAGDELRLIVRVGKDAPELVDVVNRGRLAPLRGHAK